MSFQLKFEQKGDFQAWYACQTWLNDRGYSYGPTSARAPGVGVLKGDFCIAKMHNLTKQEISQLDGIVDGNFREGPVTLRLKVAPKAKHDKEYFVISLNHNQRSDSYVILWAENNSGYRGRIESAGRYSEEKILSNLGYYNSGCSAIAVPCEVLERLAEPVKKGFFDTDDGRWVVNCRKNWTEILKNIVRNPSFKPEPEYKGSRRKQEA
ncbi:TPA: hypothetical protein PXQ76_002528 [Yersinia enterocolitica]|nr:hypothetical protein [Yersinia enterocolitica]HDL8026166.1 hypothetical protein [Yersinia enterocolitica]HDL8160850.1 hypothetical protein [Yersinia enterocolitica]HDL8164696.1 hypothetical protein [Yersinia enterocolitica]HDL8168742.1 hypothetical protein [Yersinia enterocolitica]